jgi:hypothetical protein
MKRRNPTLLILHNPVSSAADFRRLNREIGRMRSMERVPNEQAGRKAWARFHQRSGHHAKVQKIEDIPGLPDTVVVLGVFEGIEWVRQRSAEQVESIECDRNVDAGPWLVTDVASKRLWVVADHEEDLADLPTNGFARAVFYYPPKNSGKHDPERAYRHAFGDEGGNEEDGIEDDYPRLSGRGRYRSFVDGSFTITPRGLVR